MTTAQVYGLVSWTSCVSNCSHNFTNTVLILSENYSCTAAVFAFCPRGCSVAVRLWDTQTSCSRHRAITRLYEFPASKKTSIHRSQAMAMVFILGGTLMVHFESMQPQSPSPAYVQASAKRYSSSAQAILLHRPRLCVGVM